MCGIVDSIYKFPLAYLIGSAFRCTGIDWIYPPGHLYLLLSGPGSLQKTVVGLFTRPCQPTSPCIPVCYVEFERSFFPVGPATAALRKGEKGMGWTWIWTCATR